MKTIVVIAFSALASIILYLNSSTPKTERQLHMQEIKEEILYEFARTEEGLICTDIANIYGVDALQLVNTATDMSDTLDYETWEELYSKAALQIKK